MTRTVEQSARWSHITEGSLSATVPERVAAAWSWRAAARAESSGVWGGAEVEQAVGGAGTGEEETG